jgi:hypothetical protein
MREGSGRVCAQGLRAAIALGAFLMPLAGKAGAQTFTFSEPAQSTTNYTVATIAPNTFLTGSITLNVPNQGVGYGDATLSMPYIGWGGTETTGGVTSTIPAGNGTFPLFQQGPGTATGSFTNCGNGGCSTDGFPEPLNLSLINFSVPNAPAVTAMLTVTPNKYAQMVVQPSIVNGGIQVLALAKPASAGSLGVNLYTAAQAMGFSHFNWVQTIVSSTTLSVTCQVPGAASTSFCRNYTTVNSTVPNVPTFDPPLGGWGY